MIMILLYHDSVFDECRFSIGETEERVSSGDLINGECYVTVVEMVPVRDEFHLILYFI